MPFDRWRGTISVQCTDNVIPHSGQADGRWADSDEACGIFMKLKVYRVRVHDVLSGLTVPKRWVLIILCFFHMAHDKDFCGNWVYSLTIF